MSRSSMGCLASNCFSSAVTIANVFSLAETINAFVRTSTAIVGLSSSRIKFAFGPL